MASFMAPAYIRTLKGMPRHQRQTAETAPKNANDHEQWARVHPAQPYYSVVVPAPELSSVDVAVMCKIGQRWAFRKRQTADGTRLGFCIRTHNLRANWSIRDDLSSLWGAELL